MAQPKLTLSTSFTILAVALLYSGEGRETPTRGVERQYKLDLTISKD